MDKRDAQARIDAVQWFHEFDFGDGLRARSHAPDVEDHRRIWRFIEGQLETVDFRGKSVLDIGAWDGYWSFYAERRGARSVLASDDATQNWSDGGGLLLAKELLGSNVEVKQDLPIYELRTLGRKFDVVICFGVYYHLIDPFYAFAQLRHCCHSGSLVLLEGDAGRNGMRADEARYRFADTRWPTFVPSAPLLKNLLAAAYLRVESQAWLRPGLSRFLLGYAHHLKHHHIIDRTFIDRVFTVCTPFEGANLLHTYEPPFGLKAYDTRFRP